VLTVYVFLYGRLYLVLSGLEEGLITQPAIRDNKPLQVALASQSFVQIGFLMALPMLMEIGLERGFHIDAIATGPCIFHILSWNQDPLLWKDITSWGCKI